MTASAAQKSAPPGKDRHPSDRQLLILAAVVEYGVVTLQEVSSLAGTSVATARRDLRRLAEDGLVRRTHGGAAASALMSHEQAFVKRERHAAAEKLAIATIAAGMVRPGDTIALGPGTTTLALARILCRLEELTVVTNSLPAALALSDKKGIDIVLTGGSVRPSTGALVGPIAEQTLSQLFVSTVFLSGNGLTAIRGLSTPDVPTAAVDRRLVNCSDRIVVLADYSKFGVDMMALTVPTQRIDCLITDTSADATELARFRAARVDVHLAECSASGLALGGTH